MLWFLYFCLLAILQESDSYSLTLCEHHSGTLSCSSGGITVTSATYGRNDGSTCGSSGTRGCHASSSYSVMTSRCNGHSSCSISASNSIFGDPCSGTYKYLKVEWSCAVNGNWGSWGSYGSCSKSCASGSQTRYRSCNNPAPSNGGSYCSGSSSQTASCNTHNCPINGGWGSWGSWGSCSLTCGGGSQSRSRSCNNPTPQYGGSSCPNSATSSQSCNTHNCPIDGGWSSWGSWGSCTVTCGGGTQDRSRTCTNPSPQYGGASCPNSATSTQACNTHHCPIDGEWTSWTSWDTCTVTCGGGIQSKSRTCDNPPPQYGGAYCVGYSSNTQTCNTHNCPIDGNWASWTAWGTCSLTCGGGSQSRSRTCTDPSPQYGGASCVGASTSSQDCNTQNCPIDGSWASWGSWGSCTVTCGGGTQEKTRSCSNPAPQYGGALCTGASSDTQDCNTQVCIIDGNWGDWGAWGTCSVTCGGGIYSRARTCNNPAPANGGLDCPGSPGDFGDCNTAACPTVAAGTYIQLCPLGWFTCQSGSMTCIDAAFQCDCSNDCDDGSDESSTYASCSLECPGAAPGTHQLSVSLLILSVVITTASYLFFK